MLRPAREDDLENVRRWRNHPQVQAVSLQRTPITPEMHQRWWQAQQADPGRLVLVYERGGIPCGVVSFFDIEPTPVGRRAKWGYYLDNEGLQERGELLPAWMQIQREAVRYADTDLDLSELRGEVIDANAAVRRMNTRNGFEEIDSSEHQIDGESVLVHEIRRLRPAP